MHGNMGTDGNQGRRGRVPLKRGQQTTRKAPGASQDCERDGFEGGGLHDDADRKRLLVEPGRGGAMHRNMTTGGFQLRRMNTRKESVMNIISYRQNKTDFCVFCGDILGLGPRLVVDKVTSYFPFECITRQVIACIECRKELGHKAVIGMQRCAQVLDKAYQSEFENKFSATEWRGRDSAVWGEKLSRLVEMKRRRAFILSAKLRNLGLVGIGQKAVSSRRLRAHFESIKAQY